MASASTVSLGGLFDLEGPHAIMKKVRESQERQKLANSQCFSGSGGHGSSVTQQTGLSPVTPLKKDSESARTRSPNNPQVEPKDHSTEEKLEDASRCSEAGSSCKHATSVTIPTRGSADSFSAKRTVSSAKLNNDTGEKDACGEGVVLTSSGSVSDKPLGAGVEKVVESGPRRSFCSKGEQCIENGKKRADSPSCYSEVSSTKHSSRQKGDFDRGSACSAGVELSHRAHNLKTQLEELGKSTVLSKCCILLGLGDPKGKDSAGKRAGCSTLMHGPCHLSEMDAGDVERVFAATAADLKKVVQGLVQECRTLCDSPTLEGILDHFHAIEEARKADRVVKKEPFPCLSSPGDLEGRSEVRAKSGSLDGAEDTQTSMEEKSFTPSGEDGVPQKEQISELGISKSKDSSQIDSSPNSEIDSLIATARSRSSAGRNEKQRTSLNVRSGTGSIQSTRSVLSKSIDTGDIENGVTGDQLEGADCAETHRDADKGSSKTYSTTARTERRRATPSPNLQNQHGHSKHQQPKARSVASRSRVSARSHTMQDQFHATVDVSAAKLSNNETEWLRGLVPQELLGALGVPGLPSGEKNKMQRVPDQFHLHLHFSGDKPRLPPPSKASQPSDAVNSTSGTETVERNSGFAPGETHYPAVQSCFSSTPVPSQTISEQESQQEEQETQSVVTQSCKESNGDSAASWDALRVMCQTMDKTVRVACRKLSLGENEDGRIESYENRTGSEEANRELGTPHRKPFRPTTGVQTSDCALGKGILEDVSSQVFGNSAKLSERARSDSRSEMVEQWVAASEGQASEPFLLDVVSKKSRAGSTGDSSVARGTIGTSHLRGSKGSATGTKLPLVADPDLYKDGFAAGALKLMRSSRGSVYSNNLSAKSRPATGTKGSSRYHLPTPESGRTSSLCMRGKHTIGDRVLAHYPPFSRFSTPRREPATPPFTTHTHTPQRQGTSGGAWPRSTSRSELGGSIRAGIISSTKAFKTSWRREDEDLLLKIRQAAESAMSCLKSQSLQSDKGSERSLEPFNIISNELFDPVEVRNQNGGEEMRLHSSYLIGSDAL